MIEPGRGWAYFALFTEIGLIFLVTTLAGVLVGIWVDQQLGTVALFAVIGLLVGFGAGGVGVYRLISRFLSTIEE
jgi:F0F1-type ATP synthase assembly protein I